MSVTRADVASEDAADRTPHGEDALVDSRCPHCGGAFHCGATDPSCWCETLPPLDLTRLPENLCGCGCLCAVCLHAAVAMAPTASA